MKLKNRKTGEIVSLEGEITFDDKVRLLKHYHSLAELCEEWEDYEEPKELYIVDARHEFCVGILKSENEPEWCARLIELGLGFETEAEAEKVVEKLKAWKRLKDKGFGFSGYTRNHTGTYEVLLNREIPYQHYNELEKDLDLLFGGEE